MPSKRHRVRNSSVPTSLYSTVFHAKSYRGGLLSISPIPSRHSYPETKLPPGQRYIPESSSFSSLIISARKPSMLSAGISDATPILNDPCPAPTISSRPSPVSAAEVKFRGNFVYSPESELMDIVWRSSEPEPQTRLISTFASASPARKIRPVYFLSLRRTIPDWLTP